MHDVQDSTTCSREPSILENIHNRADYSTGFVSVIAACAKRTGAAVSWNARDVSPIGRSRRSDSRAAVLVVFAHAQWLIAHTLLWETLSALVNSESDVTQKRMINHTQAVLHAQTA